LQKLFINLTIYVLIQRGPEDNWTNVCLLYAKCTKSMHCAYMGKMK